MIRCTEKEIIFSLPHAADIIAMQWGKPVSGQTFVKLLGKACAHLAKAQGDVLITCPSRLEFAAALLATWLQKKTAILPPNSHPSTLELMHRNHSHASHFEAGWTQTFAEVGSTPNEHVFAPDTAAVTLYTSGSTGEPKAITKTFGNLFAEASMLATAFDWPQTPVVATVPPLHLYGLTFSLLLPLMLQQPWVDETPLHTEEVVGCLQQNASRTLITVPVHLRALLEQQPHFDDIFCVASAGALPETVALRWHELYGTDILEIYGSSETGVIASRHQRSSHDWEPAPKVTVTNNSDGLLCVTSPFTMAGEGQTLITGDAATLHESNRFTLHGRADSIVKIAGKRISTTAIEKALQSCEGVLDAAVLAVPVESHVRDIMLLAAVSASDPALNATQLKSQLRKKLADAEIPRKIVLMPQLPREENGKLSRQRLLAALQV